ncbi:N-6 DNA methylase [Pelagicoccus sp. SDUM812002]|uniref:HsdM family class I SAM-dependent methyltransferase n=1 Tax=Pelagicoccus sp. SDUM812002 TaxID=3041266 RepID=UPI00280DF9BD|nr:N-6 DNA methylase [Pelagicoccus sp. SDUM812002]MDQ8187428.1 N-6 DNA methylase [Pelagicoccus sp. SDUM812002]
MSFSRELSNYGISAETSAVRVLDGAATPELLDYLDLQQSVTGKRSQGNDLLPDGVVESQGRPLLFIVNESRLAKSPSEQDQQLSDLRRKLACRGDRAYLARIRPGELAVVPVSLDERTPEWQPYTSGTSEALTFFSRLANGQYDGKGEPKDADYVFSAMYKLVWNVADRLAALRLKRTDVLSLMGRALFFRFLYDRNIVREEDCPKIAPKARSIGDCFANAENTASTSTWLDNTFNGDLLPLTDDGSTSYFEGIGKRTGGRVFLHLTAILRGEEPIGDSGWQTLLNFRPEERTWGTYDFAHVPVGLLSQVYERFAWKWEHKTAKETSVHYTPRNIADTMVDEAFTNLPNAASARVLDPACGASVFLVLAFRRLYQEKWKATKQRPNTKKIREILNKQIVGFDISESAIKLAALSLYLTAIELDPAPVPPEKLKFRKLRDNVLFNFRREEVDPEEGAVAGSLGAHVGNRFDNQFNLILSNPPWTSLKGKERPLADELNQLSKEIISRRTADNTIAAAYENPDLGPDLPFLWKATEWCKPDGRIAMALPARILLKQEAIPRRARETFLKQVEVTGIINGTNLSDTPVWPKMAQPFILLFARNRKPKAGHSLRLITPQFDKSLNKNGEMRIDTKSIQPIQVESTFELPWIWKALALGTSLDVEVVKNLNGLGKETLRAYWQRLNLLTTQGYRIAESQAQLDASFLKGLPNITHSAPGDFIINPQFEPPFSRESLNRPRKKENYSAPLVLVKVAPRSDAETCRAVLCLEDSAFNESFYGYSTAGHPQAELLAKHLQLFTHSTIWMHYLLNTSSEYAAERRKLQKGDLDECPFYPLESLSAKQLQTVEALSRRLIAQDRTVFDEIDSFFGELFGLDSKAMEVVRDTVEVAMPYIESRNRACNPPRPLERECFRKRLQSILRPFFKITGDEPLVELWKPAEAFLKTSSPFGLLLISKQGTTAPSPDSLFRDVLLKLADDTGSTRIIQQVDNGLLVAVLNQYRYWTPSRARLLGAELVREHLDVFDT